MAKDILTEILHVSEWVMNLRDKKKQKAELTHISILDFKYDMLLLIVCVLSGL